MAFLHNHCLAMLFIDKHFQILQVASIFTLKVKIDAFILQHIHHKESSHIHQQIVSFSYFY